MNPKVQRAFRKELERIPQFSEYEKTIEDIIASAPADKPYEFLVACLCPQIDAAIPLLNGQKNTAVLISVALAKLIVARREGGFPA